MIDVFRDEEGADMLEIPSPDDTTVEVISQFGTARESTLAMLQSMPPEAWDDPNHGRITIQDATGALLANDVEHLKQIVRLLGSPLG
jgi:hypothetical protein